MDEVDAPEASLEDIPDCSLIYNFCEEEHHLSCIGQELTTIPEQFFDQEFTSTVRRLDLSFNALRNLDGIENFTHLEELTLDNNQIRHTGAIPNLQQLHTLMLNKNCIDKLEPFASVIEKQLPSLTYISLLGNNACPNQLTSIDNDEDDYQRYRLYIIYKLPKLKFIDASPVTKLEREEAQLKGQFLTSVVRPTDLPADINQSIDMAGPYHPLPALAGATASKGKEPVGTYGTCKYIYYGRHSEGNRFIRNNDL